MTNPALDTQTTAGLFVVGKEVPIPLDGVSVEATVRDFCTRVVLTQRYNNREKKPIEAVYVFPVDETAAVCGFEALIDDVHVVGEVQEKDEAFETYDEAIAGGHGAYLLDQERPDVFTASIGNIPPGKEVMVRITYVTELSLAGDDFRFVLPTTVSPPRPSALTTAMSSSSWPFPSKPMEKSLEKAKSVIVVEQNFGQLVLIVRYHVRRRLPVVHLAQIDGEMMEPEKIIAKVTELW